MAKNKASKALKASLPAQDKAPAVPHVSVEELMAARDKLAQTKGDLKRLEKAYKEERKQVKKESKQVKKEAKAKLETLAAGSKKEKPAKKEKAPKEGSKAWMDQEREALLEDAADVVPNHTIEVALLDEELSILMRIEIRCGDDLDAMQSAAKAFGKLALQEFGGKASKAQVRVSEQVSAGEWEEGNWITV